MGGRAKQNQPRPAPANEASATGRDRRAVRTVDLTEEDSCRDRGLGDDARL